MMTSVLFKQTFLLLFLQKSLWPCGNVFGHEARAPSSNLDNHASFYYYYYLLYFIFLLQLEMMRSFFF